MCVGQSDATGSADILLSVDKQINLQYMYYADIYNQRNKLICNKLYFMLTFIIKKHNCTK